MTSHSYMFTPRRVPYNYQTVPEALEERAKETPDHVILVNRKLDGCRETMTYQTLYLQSVKMAKHLVNIGIKKGENVGIYGPNSLQWVVAEIAIIMAGAVAVHLTTVLNDPKGFVEKIKMADCVGLVIDQGTGDEQNLFISSCLLEFNDCLKVVLLREGKKEFDRYDDLPSILSKDHSDVELPKLSPEDDIIVFKTSGSTGEPNMVAHTHFGVLNVEYFQGPDRPSVLYNDRPFGWISGSPLVNIAYRTRRVFADSSYAAHKSNVMKIWNWMREEKTTHALLAPFFLADLINFKDEKKDSFLLNSILLGGQIIDDSSSQALGVYSEFIWIGFGLTENCGVTTLYSNIGKGEKIVMGDVGQPSGGVEMKIIDDSGSTLPRDEPGELCIRSRVVFQKYYKNPEASQKAFLSGQWFRTGDIAVITKSNRIVIKGRIKNVISRGSAKIFPEMIEKTLSEMNGISHVVIVPVPDKRLYQEIVVCFVVKDNCDVTEDDVKEFSAQKFDVTNSADGYGVMPGYFLKFKNFPILGSGKPEKKQIQLEALRRLGIKEEK